MSVGSLIGLIVAIYVASNYAPALCEVMLKQFVLTPSIASVISYFIIFAGVALLCFFISKLLDKFFKVVMLSWLNRLLGAAFGVVKYALIVSVILNLVVMAENFYTVIPEKTKSESVLYKPVLSLVPTILPYVKFHITGDGQN